MDPARALEFLMRKTLLIVVDTHIRTMLDSEELYNQCKYVAVIDHHRKMVGHIDNAVIFYHEPHASSASEMVTELLQYISDEDKAIGALDAEALMAGITLDTKNFVLKTGVRTFEAAAYLRRMGADTVAVKQLFSSNMEAYQLKSKIISGAKVYKNCAVAYCSANNPDLRVIAPQAADELLSISNVDASFVLYKTPAGIQLSARSLGQVNVQVIMEQLGGGGHHTMAGAFIKDEGLEGATNKLLDAIDQYIA